MSKRNEIKIKQSKEITDLTEIRTKLDCYRDFNDSLLEISESLGVPSGTGMYLSHLADEYEHMGDFYELYQSSIYGIRLSRLDSDKDFLAKILLFMWRNAHAKLAEISFLLEQSIEALEIVETKTLNDMERSTARED